MGFYSEPEAPQMTMEFAEAGPCPVCGDPTGNCKGESGFSGAIQISPPALPDPFATFTVPDRVYVKETIKGRTRKKLLYAKGDRIRTEEAKRLGLL